MKKYLLPDGCRSYKANMHCHSTVSDGKFTPQQLKDLYMDKGYSIVAFTDHERIAPQNALSDDKFLALTAYEVAVNDGNPKFRTAHLNFYATDKNNVFDPCVGIAREYTPECKGHFGLAAKYYCHFTSPIRRYPDLQIHRIIKEALNNKLTDKHISHFNHILPEVTKNCSITERRADDAERDTEKLKKAEYMMGYIGEEYEGVISGVTNFGIYVELPNTIEGMVSVNNMRGYYVFDENHYEMFNETTHKTYKLGQKVRVVVVDTNAISRTIDFMFAQDYEE